MSKKPRAAINANGALWGGWNTVGAVPASFWRHECIVWFNFPASDISNKVELVTGTNQLPVQQPADDKVDGITRHGGISYNFRVDATVAGQAPLLLIYLVMNTLFGSST